MEKKRMVEQRYVICDWCNEEIPVGYGTHYPDNTDYHRGVHPYPDCKKEMNDKKIKEILEERKRRGVN